MLTLSMGDFSEFYEKYLENNGQEMPEDLREISFLNRIFIFKKKVDEEEEEEEVEEEEEN